MKAAVFREVNVPMEVEEVDISKPGPREVLVRTVAAGVCHSDMHFFNGTYPGQLPIILGHESAGIVEQVGSDVRYVQPGDHVITCLSAFCGHCEYCLTGHLSLCQEPELRRGKEEEPRLSMNSDQINQFANLSSFAEYMLVHEHAIVKIREDMPLDRAALIGCGVLTGFGAALRTARVEPGSTTAVFGAGGVGLAAIQGCRIAGAGQIIAVDMVESKLGLAKELGATHTIDASQGDAVAKSQEITGGGAHYTFEAIGNKDVAEQAFDALRAGGTATIIGMIPLGQKVELNGASFLQEKKVQGCMMGSNRFRVDMPRYVDFYLRGILKLDEMISVRAELKDVNEAFRAMKAGEVARTVLMFD